VGDVKLKIYLPMELDLLIMGFNGQENQRTSTFICGYIIQIKYFLAFKSQKKWPVFPVSL
jgi:hypothetical protein